MIALGLLLLLIATFGLLALVMLAVVLKRLDDVFQAHSPVGVLIQRRLDTPGYVSPRVWP